MCSSDLFRKIHIYVSLFFLPMALIYALTGALNIFGFTQDSGAKITKLEIESAMPKEKAELRDFVIKNLEERGVEVPGDTEIKQSKRGVSMGGIKYNVRISSIDENRTSIDITDRGLFGSLLLLHKAKGGYYFDILAVSFSIALIMLYFSGLFITAFCKNRRAISFGTVAIGAITTAVLAYMSV